MIRRQRQAAWTPAGQLEVAQMFLLRPDLYPPESIQALWARAAMPRLRSEVGGRAQGDLFTSQIATGSTEKLSGCE